MAMSRKEAADLKRAIMQHPHGAAALDGNTVLWNEHFNQFSAELKTHGRDSQSLDRFLKETREKQRNSTSYIVNVNNQTVRVFPRREKNIDVTVDSFFASGIDSIRGALAIMQHSFIDPKEQQLHSDQINKILKVLEKFHATMATYRNDASEKPEDLAILKNAQIEYEKMNGVLTDILVTSGCYKKPKTATEGIREARDFLLIMDRQDEAICTVRGKGNDPITSLSFGKRIQFKPNEDYKNEVWLAEFSEKHAWANHFYENNPSVLTLSPTPMQRGTPNPANAWEEATILCNSNRDEPSQIISGTRLGITSPTHIKNEDERRRITTANHLHMIADDRLKAYVEKHLEMWDKLLPKDDITIPILHQTLVDPGTLRYGVTKISDDDRGENPQDMIAGKKQANEALRNALKEKAIYLDENNEVHILKADDKVPDNARRILFTIKETNNGINLWEKNTIRYSDDIQHAQDLVDLANEKINLLRTLPPIDSESLEIVHQFLASPNESILTPGKKMTDKEEQAVKVLCNHLTTGSYNGYLSEQSQKNLGLLLQAAVNLKSLVHETTLGALRRRQDLNSPTARVVMGSAALIAKTMTLPLRAVSPSDRSATLGQALGDSNETTYKACYERIIAELLGVRMGGCKSALDREQEISELTGAMYRQFHTEGKIIHYHDDLSEKARFRKTFADTQHKHNMAEASTSSFGTCDLEIDGVLYQQESSSEHKMSTLAEQAIRRNAASACSYSKYIEETLQSTHRATTGESMLGQSSHLDVLDLKKAMEEKILQDVQSMGLNIKELTGSNDIHMLGFGEQMNGSVSDEQDEQRSSNNMDDSISYELDEQSSSNNMDESDSEEKEALTIDAITLTPKAPVNNKDSRYDHQNNYLTRGEAYHNGFNLMLDNMPEDNFKLTLEINRLNPLAIKNLKERVKAECNKHYQTYISTMKSVKNFHDGEKLLLEYLGNIRDVAEKLIGGNDIKNIFKQLLAAENFATWRDGRKVLATVSDHEYQNLHNETKKQTIVQIEIPRCRLTAVQEAEYLKIYSKNDKEVPKWFTKLPHWQQNYLKDTLHEARNTSGPKVSDLLKTIPTTLRGIPGLANYSEHVLLVYEDGKLKLSSHRARSGIVTAIDLAGDEKLCKQLTRQNIAQVIMTSLSEKISAHITKWGIDKKKTIDLPILFQTLVSPGLITKAFSGKKSDENLMHQFKAEVVKEIADAFHILQTNNTNPEKINKAKKTLEEIGFTINTDNTLCLKAANDSQYNIHPHFISTNRTFNRQLASLGDITKAEKNNGPNAIRLIKDAAHFIKDIAAGFILKMVDKTHGDLLFDSVKDDLKQIVDLLNRLKQIDKIDSNLSELIKAKLNSVVELIKMSDQSDSPQQKQDILILFNALQQYIEFPEIVKRDDMRNITKGLLGTKPPLNRRDEFFYASLEQIIVERIGGLPYGSCKSGKDRKGTEILHTDAMYDYFSRYGELPHYEDNTVKRNNFCRIFSELYFTRHQQQNAQENAPGSLGLKGVHKSLPDDLKEIIGIKELENCNHYADLNKPAEDMSAMLKHFKDKVTQGISKLRVYVGSEVTKMNNDSSTNIITSPSNSQKSAASGSHPLSTVEDNALPLVKKQGWISEQQDDIYSARTQPIDQSRRRHR